MQQPVPTYCGRRSRAALFVPIALLVLYVAQCVWFMGTQSFTYDEPVHIAEGLDAWRNGRFEQYNDHPPLARLLCTIPLVASKWQVEVRQLPESFRITGIAPDPEAMAWRARAMNVILGLMLGLLIWQAARRLFGDYPANFALALFALSPSLIAHFSIATTDGAATLLIFVTAWLVASSGNDPSLVRTVIVGVTLGLLLLAKYSTLPMFVLALVWILALRPEGVRFNPLRWNWKRGVAAFILALLVLWAGYFFHVSHLSVRDGVLTATFPNWTAPIVKPVHSPNYSVWIPAGEYIQGFRDLARHNAHGQRAFFLGDVSLTGGWKLYYPVAILLKWPIVVLVISLAGLVMIALRKLRLSSNLWIMLSFPALYLALAIFARFNIGERHILPVYPFALMIAAALATLASSRALKTMLIGLIALHAMDVLRFAPDYLSYFTPAVSPRHSYRLLSDSNVDWGQGLIALRRYEAEHPNDEIWLAYFGSIDPKIYGIRAKSLAENQHVTGTVVVSATDLSGQYLNDPNSYHWLFKQAPVGMLNHSLFVFRIGSP